MFLLFLLWPPPNCKSKQRKTIKAANEIMSIKVGEKKRARRGEEKLLEKGLQFANEIRHGAGQPYRVSSN